MFLISSLLKTVKSAEDKASRGTRALEIAVDAVSNDIKSLDNAASGAVGATPEVIIWHVTFSEFPSISSIFMFRTFSGTSNSCVTWFIVVIIRCLNCNLNPVH